MSADNAIYVLETHGPIGIEYRVREGSASYMDGVLCDTSDSRRQKLLREFFAGCTAYTSSDEAYAVASEEYASCAIVEYGIQTIRENMEFEAA
jgi:hypothetical protein